MPLFVFWHPPQSNISSMKRQTTLFFQFGKWKNNTYNRGGGRFAVYEYSSIINSTICRDVFKKACSEHCWKRKHKKPRFVSHPPRVSLLHGSTLGFHRVVNHPACPPWEIHCHEGVLRYTPLGGNRNTWQSKCVGQGQRPKVQRWSNTQMQTESEQLYICFLNLPD